MRVIIKSIFWFISIIIYRTKINGKENIPKEGAALICPNHIHALDSLILILNIKRKLNALAKEELFKNKILKWLANIFGVYPIKRNSADIGAVKTSLKILKNKELLLVFPEGTRNGMAKGKPIKNGAIIMAIKAGVPIIPVGIKGNFKVFSKISVNIGKPIYYDEYKDKINDKEAITKLSKELMKEIVRLRDENT